MYGIQWYETDGDRDRKTQSLTFVTMSELLLSLCAAAAALGLDDPLSKCLECGPQVTIYWITDTVGFAFYRPD